jgi:hypothetical protein
VLPLFFDRHRHATHTLRQIGQRETVLRLAAAFNESDYQFVIRTFIAYMSGHLQLELRYRRVKEEPVNGRVLTTAGP